MTDDQWLDPEAVSSACKLLGAPPFNTEEFACLVQNPNYARVCERKWGGSATWRRACREAAGRIDGQPFPAMPRALESRPVAAFSQTWLWGSSDPQ